MLDHLGPSQFWGAGQNIPPDLEPAFSARSRFVTYFAKLATKLRTRQFFFEFRLARPPMVDSRPGAGPALGPEGAAVTAVIGGQAP